MTARAEYTDEEWGLLYLSPWIVGAAVSYAERGGTLRELMTIVTLTAMVRERHPGNELLGSLWSTPQGTATPPEPTAGIDQKHFESALLERAVDTCHKVVALLEERSAPEEAEGFRQLLGEIAAGVACSARSGGFLGVGGELVTPAEHAAVDAIRAALGLEPMPAEDEACGAASAPPPPDFVGGAGPGIPNGPIDPS